MALSKIRQGQLQNALLWAVRAHDPQMTGTLVDRILEGGAVDVIPVLRELIPKFTGCGERLLFLKEFCEFTELVKCRSWKKATSLFCQLIHQDIIPKA